MDSPGPPPDGKRRALDTRRRLRLLAVTVWTGFLGGALTLLTAIALLPGDIMLGAGWAELSIGFLCAWVLAMVPVSLALILVAPRADDRASSRDGR